MKHNFTTIGKRILMFIIFTSAFFVCKNADAQVGINNPTPNANAALDIVAGTTAKGLLIPRLSTADRTAIAGLTATEDGLMVYDTDTKTFWYYNATAWAEVGAGVQQTVINNLANGATDNTITAKSITGVWSYTAGTINPGLSNNNPYTNPANYAIGDVNKLGLSGGVAVLKKDAATYLADATGSGTATASSFVAATFEADKAFNNNTGDRWQCATGGIPAWLKYNFGGGNAKIITRYTIAPFIGSDNYAPKNWVFEGSNDDITYTPIDTRTNVTTGWTSLVSRTFDCSNTMAYQYYRLSITGVNNGLNIGTVVEMEMMENSYYMTGTYITTNNNSQIINLDKVNSIAITQTTPSNTSVKYYVSFDGRATWQYYSGGWQNAASIDDIATTGNTSAELISAIANYNPSGTPATFDIAAYLDTDNGLVTPTLDLIVVNYDEELSGSYQQIFSGYTISRDNQTGLQTFRLKNTSGSTKTFIVDYLRQ